MNRWFGERAVLAIQQELPHTETPVGEPCLWCEEPIEEGDNGFVTPYIGESESSLRAWHKACWQRQSMGGLNHIEGRCTCQGGTEPPDPPELTKREAAVAAVAAYERTHG